MTLSFPPPVPINELTIFTPLALAPAGLIHLSGKCIKPKQLQLSPKDNEADPTDLEQRTLFFFFKLELTQQRPRRQNDGTPINRKQICFPADKNAALHNSGIIDNQKKKKKITGEIKAELVKKAKLAVSKAESKERRRERLQSGATGSRGAGGTPETVHGHT